MRHFFSTVNRSCKLVARGLWSSFRWLQVTERSRFSDALEEMSGCVSNIICIAQITFEFVSNAMLVNKVRFGPNHFDVISDFLAGKYSEAPNEKILAKYLKYHFLLSKIVSELFKEISV